MPVKIRKAEPGDAPAIVEFNRRLAWETEKKQLDPAILERGVIRVLADPAGGFYLVADAGDDIIAQLMVTFEWSDWRNGWFWWLQSVYVREDHRRSGVFRSLFDELVKRARAAGDVVGLRLYVENDNHRAQATYERLGLAGTGYSVREWLLIGTNRRDLRILRVASSARVVAPVRSAPGPVGATQGTTPGRRCMLLMLTFANGWPLVFAAVSRGIADWFGMNETARCGVRRVFSYGGMMFGVAVSYAIVGCMRPVRHHPEATT